MMHILYNLHAFVIYYCKITNMLLQQQYHARNFKTYFELISCLLVAEQNNELLMKNYQKRPIGLKPFPEVNATRRGRGV